jgi:hypothetical protein
MRNKATLLALVLAFAACGSGAEKAAFDRYERSVSDFLTEEAGLRALYDEEYQNMATYGRQESFDRLVRQKMIPFYHEMAAGIAKVEPEGERLKQIHAKLIEYVGLREELFELDTQAAKLSDLEQPALDRLNKAMTERDKHTRAFSESLLAKPKMNQKLAGLFGPEQQAALSVVQNLSAVRNGEVPAADLLKYMDEQIDPFYSELVRKLSDLSGEGMDEEVLRVAKAYVGSTMALFISVREVAELRPKMLEELVPLRERYQNLLTVTGERFEEYREAAKSYRDSLR